MNYQTNVNDDSLDEATSLQNEIDEVKKLSHFRKEKKFENVKKSSIQNIFAIVSGLVLLILGFVLFVMNQNTSVLKLFSGITFAIGAVVLFFGIFFLCKARGTKKNNKVDVIIVPREQFLYNKELEKNERDYLCTVNAKTILNTTIKEKKFVSPLAELEDEAEAIGENKTKFVKNYDFFDITSEKLLNRFDLASKNYHVSIQKNDAMSFISHLVYSRMILLRDVNKFCRRNLSLAMERTFQSRSFYIDCNHISSEDQLLSQMNFDYAFDAAKKKKDDFVFLFLDGVKSSEIYSLLKDFLPAIFDKNNPHKVHTPFADKRYEMLPNIYFIIMLKDKEDTGLYANNDILTYAPILNLNCSIYNGDINELDDKMVSLSDLMHIASELQDNYLEESHWKKIDELQSFVNKIKPYEISNDVINFIENEVAISLSLYHDIDKTLDDVFAIDILPGVISYIPENRVFGEDSLESYISENLYSEFSLPKTETLLKDYSYTSTHALSPSVIEGETTKLDSTFDSPIQFDNVSILDDGSQENKVVEVTQAETFSQKTVEVDQGISQNVVDESNQQEGEK